jgi:ethanolaminephosphotransferase
LLYLLPFVFTVIVQAAWLSHPKFADSWIIGSPAFVPFLCAWGLQFAHQVGRIILAHVTKGDFPVWDWVWIWSVFGAADANLPLLGL